MKCELRFAVLRKSVDMPRLAMADDGSRGQKRNEVSIAGILDTNAYEWGEELFEFTVNSINDHSDGWFDDQVYGSGSSEGFRVQVNVKSRGVAHGFGITLVVCAADFRHCRIEAEALLEFG